MSTQTKDDRERGVYKLSHTSECMFEHLSSDVWTILQCMDILWCMARIHTSEMASPSSDSSHALEDGPYIGAPMYVCQGTPVGRRRGCFSGCRCADIWLSLYAPQRRSLEKLILVIVFLIVKTALKKALLFVQEQVFFCGPPPCIIFSWWVA